MSNNSKKQSLPQFENQLNNQSRYHIEKQANQQYNPYLNQINSILFAVNFPDNFTAMQLNDLFSPYGKILHREIIDKRNIGKKPYGFVEFQDIRDAVVAQEKLNHRHIQGKRLAVHFKTGQKSIILPQSANQKNNQAIDPRAKYYPKNSANNQIRPNYEAKKVPQRSSAQRQIENKKATNKDSKLNQTQKIVESILLSPSKKKNSDEEDGQIILLDEIALDQSQLNKKQDKSAAINNQRKNGNGDNSKENDKKQQEKDGPEVEFRRRETPLDLRDLQKRIDTGKYADQYRRSNKNRTRNHHSRRRRRSSSSQLSRQRSSQSSSKSEDNHKRSRDKKQRKRLQKTFNQQIKEDSTKNASQPRQKEQSGQRLDSNPINARIPIIGGYHTNMGYEPVFNPLMAFNPSDFVTKSELNNLKIRIAELQKNNLELANKVQQHQYCFRCQGIDPNQHSSMYR